MNIKIILFDPYPHGMAITNRIHLYAKGIVEAGGKVQVLVPMPTESDEKTAVNNRTSGCVDGVDFVYTCGTTIRPRSYLMRRWLEIQAVFKSTKILLEGVTKKNTQAVLLIGNEARFIICFAIVCRLLGIIYIQEKDEFPFYSKIPKTILQKLYQKLYVRYIYKLFDGIIVITEPLYNFFEKQIRKTAKLQHIPPIVDCNEFTCETKSISTPPSVVYCGNMTEKQDGVLTLISSFQLLAAKFPDVRLILMGKPRTIRDEQDLIHLIAQTKLSKRILLTGFLPRNQLVEILCNATILVLAKPQTLQAEYCFPSKLAEYLSTGNPVVVTNTGEISKYLIEGENAYLVRPGDPKALADKFSFVLKHPKHAKEVGKSGGF